MELELIVHKDYVEVIFKNTSTAELHLWELSNSWGSWSVSFEVKSEDNPTIYTVLARYDLEFTRNGPTTFALAPGKRRRFQIDLNDGWWMRDYRIAELKDKPLLVRASYHVDPPAPDEFNFFLGPVEDTNRSDAIKQARRNWREQFAAVLAKLFTGSVVSEWVVSEPPYEWLFAEAPRWAETIEYFSGKSPEEIQRRVFGLVDEMAWRIERETKRLPKTSAAQAELKGQRKVSVEHYLSNILECALEIQKAAKEAPAYLDGKVSPQISEVTQLETLAHPNDEPHELQAGGVKIDTFGIPIVYVPPGKFLMGSDPDLDENAQENELPQHEIEISQGFWIDQYIVTNKAYAAFVNDGGYQNQRWWTEAGWEWLQGGQLQGPRDSEGFTSPKQPRVGITWFEAAAYSAWRGGQLPTEAEWEYAARGPQSLIYPWGNEWNPDFPRHKRNSDFAVWSGNQGKRQTIRGTDITISGVTVEVGSRPRGKSWVNAYDMAGNVWEWCSNFYKPYPFKAPEEPIDFDHNTSMVLRGGSWDSHFTTLRSACRWAFSPYVEGHLGYSVRPIFPLQGSSA